MKEHKNCPMPWSSIAISPSGQVRPCCKLNTSMGHISEGIENILNIKFQTIRDNFDKEEKDPRCQKCWDLEDRVGHSPRNGFVEYLGESNEVSIKHLELYFSNLCNLKCRMCSGDLSSAWLKDEMFLKENKFNRDVKIKQFEQFDYDKFISQMNNINLSTIEAITIKGGEPLYQPEVLVFLKYLIEKGMASNIVLRIFTNGTLINDEIILLLKQFKFIYILVSLEAIGDLYQYIRGGKQYTIKDIEQTIIRLDQLNNIEIKIATNVNVYNIFHLPELLLWKYIFLPHIDIDFNNIVVTPKYLQPTILPAHIRKNAQLLLKQYPEFSAVVEALNRDDSEHLEQFIKFTNLLDHARNTSILEIVPELGVLFQNT